jgi:pyruvate,water dikinase
MALILPLTEAGKYPVEQVGGKAHNLGKLLQARFAVPAGFVVLPEANAQDILPHLSGGLWAVRSSAAAEDSGGQSFAGQHESFLNVSVADVPAKIIACRASSESLAAQAYRRGQGSGSRNAPGMAVIVQQMVAAQASGVAFTVDPVTGEADVLAVEMTAGSGEALVGGSAAPQSLNIPRKGKMAAIPDGLPIPTASIPVLGKLLQDVEKTFGAAQDIEWSYADDQFWLLQSRPITTIRNQWTRANIGEVMPSVVTPLTWSVFRRHLTGKEDDDAAMIRLIDGRAHLRRDAVLSSFAWLAWADQKAVGRALGLETDADRPTQRRGLLAWAASFLFLADALGLTGRLDRRVSQFTQAPIPQRGDLTQLDLPTLLERMPVWDAWTRQAFRLHLYTTTYAIGAFGMLMRLQGKKSSAENEAALLNIWQASRSAEIGQALRALAQQVRHAGLCDTLLEIPHAAQLPARLAASPGGLGWLAAWRSFFEQFGDRTSEEFELSTPRWGETPDLVLGLLQRELRLVHTETPGQASVSAKSATPGGWLFRRISLGYARFVSLRETMKHEVIRGYGALRQIYRAVGQHLVAQKRLEQVDDIFFLSASEVTQLAGEPLPGAMENIHLRRRQWQRYQAQGNMPSAIARKAATTLQGIGCSRGLVEGKARVVRTLAEGLSLQADEILVVPHADPAWTPLILSAAAVIADLGGYLSHTATVAREFGIPAVFNLQQASSLVKTGQLLRVNGETGTVEILK